MRRRLLVGLLALVSGGAMSLPGTAHAAVTSNQEVMYRKITFPVAGATSYGNTWGAARVGHQHQGTDIMGHKMEVEVAAHDGRIGWTRTDGSNMLTIVDDDGWAYWYIHINNDTPGTDDGANKPEFMFFPGIQSGVEVKAGQPIAYMGDSGNAEGTGPHLHFEIHPPDGSVVNSYWSLMLAQGRRVNDRCGFDENPGGFGAASAKTAGSYLTATTDGGVYGYGGAPFFGAMAGKRLNAPVISLVPTADDGGYYQLSADGGIFSFGDARFFGSTGGKKLNQPVVGMAATPSGNGYWLVARDGGIFAFGDARFAGSTGGMRLNQPIIGMAATGTGGGYWLVARDGGVFAFGDARFLGAGVGSPSPIVDLAATPSGNGYWMLNSAGSVLAFGDATYEGGSDRLGFCARPEAVRLAPSSTGKGYWIQTKDGNTFAFGDAPDRGSIKRQGLSTRPIADLAGF
jgi:hypothetical protein